MNATAKGFIIASIALKACNEIDKQIQEDESKMKELKEMRHADLQHSKAWDKAKLGFDRMNELKRRIMHIFNQASSMKDCDVTLTQEECALFGFQSST